MITIKSACTKCGKRYMQTRHPMLGIPGPCPDCKSEAATAHNLTRDEEAALEEDADREMGIERHWK